MDIEDVGDYLIVKASDTGIFLNLISLHKLAYYSEAWWLALKGDSLTGAEFQSWVHGPVNQELHNRFRNRQKKSFLSRLYRRDIRPEFDPAIIPDDVAEHLGRVLEVYGDLKGWEFEELTQSEQPWILARGGLGPSEPSSTVIDPAIMREFYARLVPSGSHRIPPRIAGLLGP
jgi:uncharacterized phage-associated protein